MYCLYIFTAVVMLLVGFLSGGITAFIIRRRNKKSVVKKPAEYSNYDRKQLMADQEILLMGREDYSSKKYSN